MIRRFLVALLFVACGFAAGLVLVGRIRASAADAQTPGNQAPAIATPGPVGAAGTLTDFSRIAERAVPAVVNVSARQVVRRSIQNDPFFGFFGIDEPRRSRQSIANSLGSGVVISADGYILTNNHVVTGDSQRQSIENLDVSITLSDNRKVPALLIGTDEATDLALLKVEAKGLPTVPWGDSTKLKVAEWVLAIGNPYQLSQTVTLGIVSAVNRTIGAASYEDFVQTDAAINPGNSGGALINARGELVGINTVIFSQSGGYQGIGFAVSSNLARRIFSDLQQYGQVRRGWIGRVNYVPLTPQIAAEVGSSNTKAGVVVSEIYRDAAAFRAGIEPGDIIVSFNGTPVIDRGQLWRLVSDSPIGSTVTLGVIRQGRRIDVRIPVGKVERAV